MSPHPYDRLGLPADRSFPPKAPRPVRWENKLRNKPMNTDTTPLVPRIITDYNREKEQQKTRNCCLSAIIITAGFIAAATVIIANLF